MKKVFDQTVRDLKREVNKKVLKVPGIEQKVLDATSNEPWGPHGSHLADIAQATRNYHEYQMIMSVLWKRINDTGKNWRHVYKALTVLEYLVANGSERVIDDIREHTYQISTLANFQYIDSSGRDQGNNVRRKSQTLVSLVNDKERIVEVREKAAVNREKMQKNSRYSSTGGMYRPGSYSGSGGYGDRYDDDRFDGRYGSRDEDRNSYGYGREREWGYRDDDKYGRGGESYNRDGEKFDESYGRDGPRDDDYRGRPRSVDDGQYGTRSRSSDRDRGFDDDGQYSSRGSGARAEDSSLDGRPIERRHSEQNLPRKYSEQSLGAPPSYEEAVGESRSPVHSERDGDAPVASAAPASSAPVQSSPVHETAAAAAAGNQEFESFDEFDPRGPNSAVPKTSTNVAPATSEYAAPTASSNSEMDLLGSLADPFSSNVMALVPAASATGSEADVQSHANSGTGTTFATTPSASNGMNQSFEDPFGDGPFRAVPSSENFSTQTNVSDSVSPFQPSTNLNTEQLHPGAPKVGTTTNYDFEDSFSAITYSTQNVSSVQPSTNSQFPHQELYAPQQNTDILAGILPPSEPSPIVASHTSFPGPAGETGLQGANIFGNVQPNMVSTGPVAPNIPQVQTGLGQQLQSGGIPSMGGSDMPVSLQTSAPVPSGQAAQPNGNFAPQQVPSGPTPFNSQMPSQPPNGSFAPQQVPSGPTPYTSQMPSQPPNGSPAHFNGGNFLSQQAPAAHMGTHPSFGVSGQNILPPQGSTTPVPQMFSQNSTGPGAQNSNDIMGNLFSQPSSSMTSQPKLSVSSLTAISQPNVSTSSVTPSAQQPSKDKFETKSAVWSDTLSRGLVNLNISGPKINPLSDIGIDFDALNRKEKRMEKPTTTSVTSTVNMGKAMGSGSGMGRAGAGPLRPPPNSMMNASMGMGGGPGVGMGMSGPGMGMGGGPGVGMGMGGGPGGGMGMGMGMGMGGGPSAGMGMRGSYGSMGQQPMGMGMNMGMGMGSAQGSQMPPGSNMSGGYNPMMGSGGYTQQPYGGGYR